MAVTTIDWDDGSGDKIYISADAFGGNQNVLVSSDANAGSARQKNVTFQAAGITRVLTVNQAGVPVQHTIQLNPSGYIPKATDGDWYSLSNPSNAYNNEENTTYAQIRLVRGSEHAVTYCYFTFDTSSIPENAVINSVVCRAKVRFNTSKGTRIDNRDVQMFSGTTAMGSSVDVTTTAQVYTFSGVNWTRAQLNDARIRFYGVRGTTNLSSDYYFQFYGATLEITYTI